MRKGKVWAFEAIFLNKFKPPEEKIPQKKRVKVELKIHVMMWLNSKKKKKEKMEPKKKKGHSKKKSKSKYGKEEINKKEFENK